MSDIAKCSGKGCNKKKTCYRFTAPKSEYQTYFQVPPLSEKGCEYYWKVKTVIKGAERV